MPVTVGNKNSKENDHLNEYTSSILMLINCMYNVVHYSSHRKSRKGFPFRVADR